MKYGLLHYKPNDASSAILKSYPRKDLLLGWDGTKLPLALQRLTLEFKENAEDIDVDIIRYTKQEMRALIREELNKIEEGIEKFLDITTGTVAYNYYVLQLQQNKILSKIDFSKQLPELYERCIILFNGKTLDLASVLGDKINEFVNESDEFSERMQKAYEELDVRRSTLLALLNKSSEYLSVKELKITLPDDYTNTVVEVFKGHNEHLLKPNFINFITVEVEDVIGDNLDMQYFIEEIRNNEFAKVPRSNIGVIISNYREYIESNLNKIELYDRMNKQEIEDKKLLSVIMNHQVPYDSKVYFDMLEELGLSVAKLSDMIHNKFRVPMVNIGVIYSVYEFINSNINFGNNHHYSIVNEYNFKLDKAFFERIDLYLQDFLKERRENLARVLDTPYLKEETRIAILENRLKHKKKLSKYDFFISLPPVYLNLCLDKETFRKIKAEIDSNLIVKRKSNINIELMQSELEFIRKYAALAIIDFLERESLNYIPDALDPKEVLSRNDKDPEYEKLEKEFLSLTHKDSLEEFQRRSSKFSLLNTRLLNLCRTNKFEYVNSIIQSDIVAQSHREEIFSKLSDNISYIIEEYMKI